MDGDGLRTFGRRMGRHCLFVLNQILFMRRPLIPEYVAARGGIVWGCESGGI
jgi:hypothetical protein